MSIDPTPVDNIPDDLDAFDDLFSGRVAPEPEAEVEVEQMEEEKVDDLVEDDNEEIETDEGEETKEPDEEPEPKPEKKVNRFQERINELTAKAREAERKLAELEAKQTEATTPTTPVSTEEDNGPNPDAKNEDGSDKYPLGEFDPAYIRDMARHTIDKEWKAREANEQKAQAERQEQQARAEIQEQWVSKLTPFTEQHEDFVEKTMELETTFDGLDPQYSDYLTNTIKSLDHGPEVLYYFANHIDEAEKFVKMGPLAATLALGEYNAMFKSKPQKEATPKVTHAPPPPQVNKGNKTRTVTSADTDDLDAFSQAFFKPKRGKG